MELGKDGLGMWRLGSVTLVFVLRMKEREHKSGQA